MSPVDAYLADLRKRLEGRLAGDVAEAKLREARAHLEEAVQTEGEAVALRRFGSPASNARAVVRQARGYETRGVGSLARAVGPAFAASVVASYLAAERAGPMATLQAAMGLTFVAALAFAARCLQTRRWLALPVVAWGGLGFALCSLVSVALPARVPPSLRAATVADARRCLALWDGRAREVAAWRAGRTPEHTAIAPWRAAVTRYVVGLPFPIVGSPILEYDAQTFPNRLADADRDWSRYGHAWAGTVESRRKDAAEGLAAAEAGFAERPVPLSARAGRWALCVAEISAVLLAYNALALLLGRLSDTLPRRSTAR